MKMVSTVAFANMKYHKSKNILTGIAVFLTTILLFMIPAVGFASLDAQFAMINKVYPSWHALYRNVDDTMVNELKAHRDITRYGLRSDLGAIVCDNASIAVYYIDESGMEMYRMEPEEGRTPETADEIVVSRGMLAELGIFAELGDTVTLSFQKNLEDGMDYASNREFRICGFLPDAESNLENHSYSALVSEKFLRQEMEPEQIRYRFLFQAAGNQRTQNTDDIEEMINEIAAGYCISENDIAVNDYFLTANYVDPSFAPAVAMIMLIIVAAGVITIYSIYYVSMTQRVQEFGKLKAIGATRRQIRQIVLREGFSVAALAVPPGILTATVLLKPVLLLFISNIQGGGQVAVYREIIQKNETGLYKPWLYLLAVLVTLITVWLSLLVPMHKASKISEVEAVRYHGNQVKGRIKKGYVDLTVGRLTRRNLGGNKKKSLITIFSMSVTGVFVMVVATVLSCADPAESASSDMYGSYEIVLNSERGNREHPEREWNQIIGNNPLTEELKNHIEDLEGVEKVVEFSRIDGEIRVNGGEILGTESIRGFPKECFEELKDGIIEGNVIWEDLLRGDQIILNRTMLHWYPDISVGDVLQIRINEGEKTVIRDLKIAAMGNYRFGLTGYDYLLMSKEAADSILGQNCNGYFQVLADKNYDEKLEAGLLEIVGSSDLLEMNTWKSQYDSWAQGIGLTRGACMAFLTILSLICVMNLINTMINSIHVRKKELGMLQAIGMTDRQLFKMLQMEGMFYTTGTLLISIGLGSALGYPVFLWMKQDHIFSISNYHYPAAAAVIVAAVMAAVQVLLAAILSRSIKKDSLIDRIRFSE